MKKIFSLLFSIVFLLGVFPSYGQYDYKIEYYSIYSSDVASEKNFIVSNLKGLYTHFYSSTANSETEKILKESSVAMDGITLSTVYSTDIDNTKISIYKIQASVVKLKSYFENLGLPIDFEMDTDDKFNLRMVRFMETIESSNFSNCISPFLQLSKISCDYTIKPGSIKPNGDKISIPLQVQVSLNKKFIQAQLFVNKALDCFSINNAKEIELRNNFGKRNYLACLELDGKYTTFKIRDAKSIFFLRTLASEFSIKMAKFSIRSEMGILDFGKLNWEVDNYNQKKNLTDNSCLVLLNLKNKEETRELSFFTEGFAKNYLSKVNYFNVRFSYGYRDLATDENNVIIFFSKIKQQPVLMEFSTSETKSIEQYDFFKSYVVVDSFQNK